MPTDLSTFWHNLTHSHTSASKPGVGEVILCQRRLSRRMWLSIRYADGFDIWTPAYPADRELLAAVARCESPAELGALVAAIAPRRSDAH